MKRTPRRSWNVRHGHHLFRLTARTPGHAAAIARRLAARLGTAVTYRTNHETGGWAGVSVFPGDSPNAA